MEAMGAFSDEKKENACEAADANVTSCSNPAPEKWNCETLDHLAQQPGKFGTGFNKSTWPFRNSFEPDKPKSQPFQWTFASDEQNKPSSGICSFISDKLEKQSPNACSFLPDERQFWPTAHASVALNFGRVGKSSLAFDIQFSDDLLFATQPIPYFLYLSGYLHADQPWIWSELNRAVHAGSEPGDPDGASHVRPVLIFPHHGVESGARISWDEVNAKAKEWKKLYKEYNAIDSGFEFITSDFITTLNKKLEAFQCKEHSQPAVISPTVHFAQSPAVSPAAWPELPAAYRQEFNTLQETDPCANLFSATTRAELSDKLLALREQLIVSKNRTFRQLGAVIEGQHALYASSSRDIDLYRALKFVQNVKLLFKKAVRLISSRARLILRKVQCTVRRDLRTHFRNVIHFLFKNMDDSTGDHWNMFSNSRKQFLFTYLMYCHEPAGNNRLFTGPDRQRSYAVT